MQRRNRFGVLGLLLIAGLQSLAQDAPSTGNPASVEGSVTNALTGEPLLRAHVVLRGLAGGTQQVFGALTNAEGKFSIAGVPEGSYTARAERVGSTYTADRDGRLGTQVSVRAGDKKNDLKLKLTPAGSITGRVLDAEGEAVESVSVFAEGSYFGMQETVTTDAQGQFRLGGITPGKYRVKAVPMNPPLPPEIRSDGTVEVHNTATYYPNSPNEKSATRVEVQAGAEVSAIEIRLVRAPIVRVSGRVIGLPKGAERAMIQLRQGRSGRAGTVKPDGTFDIWRVDPGMYHVTAIWHPDGKMLRTAPVDVEVAGSNVDNVELRMVPPSDIAGQVEFEDEHAKQPGSGATLPPQQPGRQQAPPPTPPRQLILRDVDMGPSVPPAALSEDGSFRLMDVQPGRYRVTLSWRSVYIKSMRLGQAAMEGSLLDLRNGGAAAGAGATLSVLVASATGELSGTVSDDKGPAAHVPVALVAEDADDWAQPNITSAGDDGSYRFMGVAPGKYKLAALEENPRGPFRAVLEDYDDVVETVELHDGDKASRDLKRHTPK